jgi:hypothetical protein
MPCWFNEGFAQYVSKSAHASYQRARGYMAKPHSEAISPGSLIPLDQLVAMTHPPSDNVEIFYDESERLVRFLASADKSSFLLFLDALGRHQPFKSALTRSYTGKFGSTSQLNEKFSAYACKDFGSSLQQIDNE